MQGERLGFLYLTQIIFLLVILSVQFLVPTRYFAATFFISAIILTVAALFWMRHRNNAFYKKISQKSIGKIDLNPNLQIELDDQNTILQSEIEEIEFHYKGYLGEDFLFKTLVYPRQQNHSFGTGNKILVKTNSSSIVKFVLISNKIEKARFFDLSKMAMQSKIPVIETIDGKRTYGGKLLKYHEIQDLKNKIANGKSI